MAHIFISYAREDEARIQPLVRALENQGWSVFWDRHIPAGQTWRSYIGKALSDAGCVIVAWSRYSIDSEWVSDEADEGKKRGMLVPVLLDAVEPPIGFRSIQAADLTDWQSAHPSPRFEQLIHDIRATLHATPTSHIHQAAKLKPEEQKPQSWWRTVPGILTAIGVVITAVAALVGGLSQIGMFDNGAESQRPDEVIAKHPLEQQTVGWTIIGKVKKGKFFDLKLMVHGDSPAIGRSYDAVEDFRLIQKRHDFGVDQGQVITLGMVHRGDTVEVLDLYVPTPSTETVPVWAKLRAILHKR